MFLTIARLLIDTAAALLGFALLLRAYMNWVGMPGRNPLFQFTYALTDWFVRPLARVLPSARRVDVPSLLGAYLMALLAVVLVQLVLGGSLAPDRVVLAGLLKLLRWILLAVFWLTLLHVLLSWINPFAPVAPAIKLLMQPFLAPFQRVLPLVGGIDLSPLALILIVNVLLIILDQVVI